VDKPGDFFVDIIDFFGILVPGAVLLYLQSGLALKYLGWSYSMDSPVKGMVFAVGAYVGGQFLMHASQCWNRPHGFFYPEKNDQYYREAQKTILLPANISNDRTNAFYRAFAYVRLNSPSGLAEIERQMAEYKMFRSMILVFALDGIFQTITNRGWPSRIFVSLGLCLAAGWQFLDLLNWTRRITFEYYTLLYSDHSKKEDKKHGETAKN